MLHHQISTCGEDFEKSRYSSRGRWPVVCRTTHQQTEKMALSCLALHQPHIQIRSSTAPTLTSPSSVRYAGDEHSSYSYELHADPFTRGHLAVPPPQVSWSTCGTMHRTWRHMVRTQPQVQHLRKDNSEDRPCWMVETVDLVITKETEMYEFDAVAVASDHGNDPFIPDIAGTSRPKQRATQGAIAQRALL